MCNATSKTEKEQLIGRKLNSTVFPQYEEFDAQAAWACHALHKAFPDYALKNARGASLCDMGKCLALLGNKDLFSELFAEFDREFFKPCYEQFGANDKNKVTSILLYFLVNECGFKNVPDIVFYGKGDAFIPVVAQGMAFKDGLSAVHGEYAHTIQWCIIGWAKMKGRIELDAKVVEVYQSLVSQYISKDEYVEEFARTKHITLWDLVCDCLNPRSGEKEDVLKTLFSESFRSPAFLTAEMLNGNLKYCKMSQCLIARYQARVSHLPVLKGQKAEDIKDYTKGKQAGKNKTIDEQAMVAYSNTFNEGRPSGKNKKKAPAFMTPKEVKATQIAAHPTVHQPKWDAWEETLSDAK